MEIKSAMVVGLDESEHSFYALDWTLHHFFSPPVYDAICKTVEGDPRSVLCEAVEKHHASGLVVGSHGTGAITRGALGSVSNYCAHHACCSVMIVKRPKNQALNLLHKN